MTRKPGRLPPKHIQPFFEEMGISKDSYASEKTWQLLNKYYKDPGTGNKYHLKARENDDEIDQHVLRFLKQCWTDIDSSIENRTPNVPLYKEAEGSAEVMRKFSGLRRAFLALCGGQRKARKEKLSATTEPVDDLPESMTSDFLDEYSDLYDSDIDLRRRSKRQRRQCNPDPPPNPESSDQQQAVSVAQQKIVRLHVPRQTLSDEQAWQNMVKQFGSTRSRTENPPEKSNLTPQTSPNQKQMTADSNTCLTNQRPSGGLDMEFNKSQANQDPPPEARVKQTANESTPKHNGEVERSPGHPTIKKETNWESYYEISSDEEDDCDVQEIKLHTKLGKVRNGKEFRSTHDGSMDTEEKLRRQLSQLENKYPGQFYYLRPYKQTSFNSIFRLDDRVALYDEFVQYADAASQASRDEIAEKFFATGNEDLLNASKIKFELKVLLRTNKRSYKNR